ncbi:hypothetical protein AEAC466_14995 [Asticcacaulis sp. AC466]|uniref:hypothetical protein n=1 Tax=Asticcacaulis sp. AC466 TaxID=1282362 RepID=UPI0003C3C2D3|nr:hypothetical protein [Asticcacaulis sp. AC466]ESQ83166.1 hypothetical protein AEAC466_14995 [Asticcacaulis sp. AC466]
MPFNGNTRLRSEMGMDKQHLSSLPSRPIAFCGLLIWALSCVTAQAGTASPSPTEHYRLEQHGGGLGVDIDESVVVLAVGDTSNGQQWVIERLRRDRNWCGKQTADGKCSARDVTVHDWAASSTCSAVNFYVAGFADFRQTGSEQPTLLVTDSPLVTLQFTAAAKGKPPHVLKEYAGPLVSWWRDAEVGLKPCWTTEPPVIDGRPLVARLTPPKP